GSHADREATVNPYDAIGLIHSDASAMRGCRWHVDDVRYQPRFRGRNSVKKPQASNRAFFPARPRPPDGGPVGRGNITMPDTERAPSGSPRLDYPIAGGRSARSTVVIPRPTWTRHAPV